MTQVLFTIVATAVLLNRATVILSIARLTRRSLERSTGGRGRGPPPAARQTRRSNAQQTWKELH